MLPRLTGAPAVSFPRSPAFRHRFDPLNLRSTPELGPLVGSRPSARGRGTSLSVTLSKGLRQRAEVPPTATVTESCRRRHVRSEIMDDFVGLLRACGAIESDVVLGRVEPTRRPTRHPPRRGRLFGIPFPRPMTSRGELVDGEHCDSEGGSDL
jgi:hypothetical protein